MIHGPWSNGDKNRWASLIEWNAFLLEMLNHAGYESCLQDPTIIGIIPNIILITNSLFWIDYWVWNERLLLSLFRASIWLLRSLILKCFYYWIRHSSQFRVRETCNLTWFRSWDDILRVYKLLTVPFFNFLFVLDDFCWKFSAWKLAETGYTTLMTHFDRILRFGCFNKRTILSMLQTWQMDSSRN